MQINGARILVTGATGGIGAALCRQLSAAGAELLLNCMSEVKLQKLLAELGVTHTPVLADISTPEGRQKIVDACEKANVNGVINLAGIMDFALFEDQADGLIEKILQVNTLAPVLLTRDLLPMLLRSSQARIVNVGSIFGSIGHPGFAVYCASKAAIKTFSEALSRELADSNVSVAYIAPRATRTALNPQPVVALNKALGNKSDAPELVAGAIARMFAGDRRFHFMGWPEKLFVKINALFPAVVHRALVKNLSIIKQYARHNGDSI